MKEELLDEERLLSPIDLRGETDARRSGHEPATVTGSALVPGIAAGLCGLIVFLVLHAMWIVPIWFVAPVGLPIAVLAGAAVNWAYLTVESRLPRGTLVRFLTIAGGAILILSPGLMVAWAGDPYFTVVDGSGVPAAGLWTLAVRFVVEFLVVTILVGALIGWILSRTRRGTVAVAVAAFALAIGPGHNIPFFHLGTAPAATKTGVLLALVPILIASAIFVAVDAFLSRGRN